MVGADRVALGWPYQGECRTADQDRFPEVVRFVEDVSGRVSSPAEKGGPQ
jgi:hypothetical protein